MTGTDEMSLGEAVKTVKRAMGEMRGMANELAQAQGSRDHWREKAGRLESELNKLRAEVDACYVRLPVDADGVPIHLGDKLRSDETGRSFPCRGYNMTLCGGQMWWAVECSYDSHCGTSEYVSARSCHHVEERTLEDVLRGLVEAAENPEGGRLDNGDIDGFADEIRDLLGVDDGA